MLIVKQLKRLIFFVNWWLYLIFWVKIIVYVSYSKCLITINTCRCWIKLRVWKLTEIEGRQVHVLWSSDAILVCFRPQLLEWTNNMSHHMMHFESFINLSSSLNGNTSKRFPTDVIPPFHGRDSSIVIPKLHLVHQWAQWQNHGLGFCPRSLLGFANPLYFACCFHAFHWVGCG